MNLCLTSCRVKKRPTNEETRGKQQTASKVARAAWRGDYLRRNVARRLLRPWTVAALNRWRLGAGEILRFLARLGRIVMLRHQPAIDLRFRF
jgi:hypothetical protein